MSDARQINPRHAPEVIFNGKVIGKVTHWSLEERRSPSVEFADIASLPVAKAEMTFSIDPTMCGTWFDSFEVEHLRAIGQLRVACRFCGGRGMTNTRAFTSHGGYRIVGCWHCNGTGWKWSEKS